MTPKIIAKKILNELKELKPYIYYEATTGSIYIKFEDTRLRSIRIADHKGRKQYRYKWNLMKNYNGSKKICDKKVNRFYFSFNDFSFFKKRIKQYWETICSHSSKGRAGFSKNLSE